MTYKNVFALALISSFAFLGCSEDELGNTVTLNAVHHPSEVPGGSIAPAGEGIPRTFTNNVGQEITITKGYIVLSSRELHACQTARIFSFIPSAYAHGGSSATRDGAPIVEDVMRADLEMLNLGSMQPPNGHYCELEITLGAADADAENLPNDVDLVGKSLWLEGEYHAGSGHKDFIIRSSAEVTREIDLELNLSADHRDHNITIGMAYDTWFEDVDFTKMSQDQISDLVLHNIAHSLHHHKGATTESHDHSEDHDDSHEHN